jgi:cephalosporin hydroxylase
MRPTKALEKFYKRMLGRLRRQSAIAKVANRPAGRKWGSGLPIWAVESIQKGAARYSYRGIRMLKNPFEMALYPLLLWEVKPRTIIEIGSNTGASAIWFADLMAAYGIDGKVISIDITVPEANVQRKNVSFLKGDALKLGEVLTPDVLSSIARPLLVIEDSAHYPETSRAVLEFFDPVLQPGEYIVIEDGNVTDLAIAHKYRGGPGVAIAEFLARASDRYEIDARLCDFFGANFTGNTNGYLKRIA